MAISRKFMAALAVILLFVCLTGCTENAAEADTDAQSGLEELTFYSPYVQYLGKPLEEIYPVLEESGEWGDNLYNQNGDMLGWILARDPVTINGLDYYSEILSDTAAFTPAPWAFYYETHLTTDNWDESIAQVKSVYDLLVSEMGEPEEMVVSPGSQEPLAQAFEEGFAESHDKQTKHAWWILEDGWTYAADSSHPERYLTFMMRVITDQDDIRINVGFSLEGEHELSNLKRFAS